MNEKGRCEFCISIGDRLSGPEDGLDSDLFICKKCIKLLKNKQTALPLIRGNLTLSLRGKGDPKKNEKLINDYMDTISKWQQKN